MATMTMANTVESKSSDFILSSRVAFRTGVASATPVA